jgi:murein L,D-transpeptidase YafK
VKLAALLLVIPGVVASEPSKSPMSSVRNPRAAAAEARVCPALERDLKAAGLEFGAPVFIRAFKEERILELFIRQPGLGKFALFRSYPIVAASGTLGPKLAEGDGQVPEGFYSVPPTAMKPDSRYHLAFNIGYPNAYDRFHNRTGSLIMVHGNRVSIGCLAMTDEKIEEIFTLCAASHDHGQKSFSIHIFPFRMTDERMEKETHSEWFAFWRNLKEGYDRFEKTRVPPKARVRDGCYEFRQ